MKTLQHLWLAFLILFLAFGFAQAQTWQNNYGSTADETGMAAVELANGNYRILCKVDTSSNPDNQFDLYYLMTISPEGTPLAYDTLGGKSSVVMKPSGGGGAVIFGTKTDEPTARPFLTRFDENGQAIWTKVYSDSLPGGLLFVDTGPIIVLEDSSILTTAYYDYPDIGDNETVNFQRVAANGDSLYSFQEFALGINMLLKLSDEHILFHIPGQFQPPTLIKYSLDGNWIWQDIDVDVNGGWAATLENSGFVHCENAGQCIEFDADGSIVQQEQGFAEWHIIRKMIARPDGSFLYIGETHDSPSNTDHADFFIHRAFQNPNSSWQFRKYFRPLSQTAHDILPTSDGGYLLAGTTETTFTGDDIYLIKVDSNGLFSAGHHLAGTLRHDANLDCTTDTTEAGLGGFVVVADGLETNYAITDSSGNYELTLSPGTYDVYLSPSSPYWQMCNSIIGLVLTTIDDTTSVDIEAQLLAECPYMTIDISTPFLRRCMSNTYYVNYCNHGTALAEDVSIEVTLAPYMQVDSTSEPISFQMDSLYIFDVGDVGIQECGTIVIYLTFDEDCNSTQLGETYCVEAQIFPDTICLADSLWSGANVELEAVCDPDSLSFFIKNTGTAPNAQALDFVIIEDEVILHEGTFQLPDGGEQIEKVPANGSTYRMEAEQEPFHPVSKFVSITVEGCSVDSMGQISMGFVNQFPEGDEAPFLSIDCQGIIGSFDPNDKTGFPTGYGTQHFIEANRSIEYRIRFQNTGTDTAFHVVILDTISPYLDPGSMRLGASSHPYTFSLYGSGIAEFRFDNIMLPDSNVNEPLSHGFVKFEIDQFPDLGPGTQIFNSAAIYFDLNDPVITNTTYHEIREDFILVSVDPPIDVGVDLSVYPNPFREFTVFEIDGEPWSDLRLEVYNNLGRLVRVEPFSGNRLIFYRARLISGIYFFQIKEGNQLMSTGKMTVAGQ